MFHFPDGREPFYSFARAEVSSWTFKVSIKRAAHLSPDSSPSSLYVIDGTFHSSGAEAEVLPTRIATTIFGYGASRRVGTTGSTPQRNAHDGSLLLSEAEHLQNPERWFLDASLTANQPSPLQRLAIKQLTEVTNVLTRVLPGISHVRVGIKETAGRISPILEVFGPDGYVPYASLSLGYRTMTAWMVDLAIRLFNRYPHLPDPLTGPAVCLVDEIDLHLHPRWQRSLMGTLSEIFPNVQFVATAHSPLMVQSAKEANVVVLRREGDRVVVDNNPPNVDKWRVDQILTSDLFGLQSARAPELDAALVERDEILGKAQLREEDELRLAELSAIIGAVPYGETPEDIEASNTIRLAAKKLAQRS